MKLASDRFYETELTKRLTLFKGLPNEINVDYSVRRFSYETKDKLFDVDIPLLRDGSMDIHSRTYHVNGSFNGPQERIHKAIEDHFSL